MLPAKSGDCFLLETDKKRILIDGGYHSTYHNELKSLLVSTSNPEIDLLIVTHIDRDHIEGVIELLKDKMPIKQIWFNSYEHLPKKVASHGLNDDEVDILREYTMPQIQHEGIWEHDVSAVQGETLSELITQNQVKWNTSVQGKAICIENIRSMCLNTNTKIVLISPTEYQLSNLAQAWINELKRKKWTFVATNDVRFGGAMEAFFLSSITTSDVQEREISYNPKLSIPELAEQTASPDKSITNASSISVLIDRMGKKLLFLADGAEEQIIPALDDLRTNYFDVIKLSHHGSLKNATKLFDNIDGEYFLISTNGIQHDHPHIATIAKIISRPSKITRKILFNYAHDVYKYYNNESLMSKYNYSVFLTSSTDPIIIA